MSTTPTDIRSIFLDWNFLINYQSPTNPHGDSVVKPAPQDAKGGTLELWPNCGARTQRKFLVASLLLVVMPFVTGGFLFLVRPGAPRSVLAPSSDARSPS